MKILITGATGNVGLSVIKSLNKLPHQLEIVAGIKDFSKDKEKLTGYNVEFVKFDFTDASTYKPALEQIDLLFLLRPPQISDTNKYFKPLIQIAQQVGVKHIIFLSVQGVEKSTIIPHHKIEKLIVESKINYTFLRPAYFMQNFLGSLHADLVDKKRIYLPARNAKFTLVDVHDIGDVATQIMISLDKHINKIYELTNNEKMTFGEMATQLSKILEENITYDSPSLFNFYQTKRKEKIPFTLILVMMMLHYLPRFQKEPLVTNCVKAIIGREPKSFIEFIKENFQSLKS